MFEQAGHQAYSWHWLSPKLDDADVIVWAPDDYEPPNVGARGALAPEGELERGS